MKDIRRYDANALRQDRLEAVTAWVSSLGVEPKDVSGKFAIVMGEQEYELHLSRFVRNDAGRIRLDLATDTVVAEPVIIGLGAQPQLPDLTGGERS
jgi:hypothetical protein